MSMSPISASTLYRGRARPLFGRERDAQLLINKLFSHPLTLLYAPSGVGKTSLLRALVIPELRAEEAQVVYFDKWNTADPCDAVAQSMAGGPVASGKASWWRRRAWP
jgi:ATP/maltotriose-dependent transcriptional regulator MalT